MSLSSHDDTAVCPTSIASQGHHPFGHPQGTSLLLSIFLSKCFWFRFLFLSLLLEVLDKVILSLVRCILGEIKSDIRKWFAMGAVRHWCRLIREVVGASSLETLRVRLDRAVSTWWRCGCPCLLQGKWDQMACKGPFQLRPFCDNACWVRLPGLGPQHDGVTRLLKIILTCNCWKQHRNF